MRNFPDHPDIAKVLRDGYLEEEEESEDEYEAYCDRLCDERREALLFDEQKPISVSVR